MSGPLHVLLYGHLDGGACHVYRFGMHREALARHGVELRAYTDYRLGVPEGEEGSAGDAHEALDVRLDRSELDWADVIVFRRFYSTQWSCGNCATVDPSEAVVRRHAGKLGHTVDEPERLIRPLFGALEAYPELLRGRALVYETDDDLLGVQPWNGQFARVRPERDIVERMLRRADLVTTATPVLADRLRAFNDAIRVVRNAVDPAWYEVPGDVPLVTGEPRLLYFGSAVRMRDYAVCRPAVDEVVARHPSARRVWLGAVGSPTGGSPDAVLAAVDEIGPFIEAPRDFSAYLAAMRPDIGLAPLVGDAFDQAKSELHWLEYTMAGAATVATRFAGGGPYDPIRHGVDGLLVDGPGEWLEALSALAGSPAMREDLASAARERILAEYTVETRAAEWADAYRWAAEHAGRAVGGRVHGLGELSAADMVAEGARALAHRGAVRAADATADARLARARGDRAACGAPDPEPLVTVVIPVIDEPASLVERAITSVLASTWSRIEVVVATAVGAGTANAPGSGALAAVRHVAVDQPPDLPRDPEAARCAWTAALLRAALASTDGAWIAPLSPEGRFERDHVEVLLGVALENDLELVYGQARIEADGASIDLGSWPPIADAVLTLGTELFARPLADLVPFDGEAWRDGEATGWSFWRRVAAAGARMASIEYVVTRLGVDA